MTVAREKASSVVVKTDCEPLEWTVEEEIQLFCALEGLKPVGVNRFFYMACIANRLNMNLQRYVPTEVIWEHLHTMYNLKMLDEMEPLPFPNEEMEFSLPETDFSTFLAKKREEGDEKQRLSIDSTGPPSIIAVATDNTTKGSGMDKSSSTNKSNTPSQLVKEMEKRMVNKLTDITKRPQKRTRGSLESNSSPSTTPPPVQSNKRRRI